MSKLSSMAKAATYKMEFPEDSVTAFKMGFEEGFEGAFKAIRIELTAKIAKMEQYPMMGERIFAIKTYMKTMEDMLIEMKSNEY